MTHPGSATKALSPNQLEKQQQIIEAARVVLARDGLAGCTARAVADASPLTKSAIHYYFADMDDLVDRAMAGHIDAFVRTLRTAADKHEQPADRFWAVVRDYLNTFQERPSVATLWFGYWISATTKNRLAAIESMHSTVTAIFTELLAAVEVDNPARRADALFSYLLGTVVREAVAPRPFRTLQSQITEICDL
ncbi:TetR/AcrR family transcriptional regulator [Fodinicola feengrottensis]|uniref:TetR family transcriptional regulator n=1 Tax=Fodinicola feengrottensis TaxID=435914 RepID=A0ABN2FPC5_9ACTN|nr:TetR family transcriptional regulator [Fodinicola feengrottensis]